MRSSNPIMVTITASAHSDFDPPDVVHTDGHAKDTTVFLLEAHDTEFGIVGTFDEITGFASAVILAMYQWPIKAGHEDWLGTPAGTNEKGETVYVIGDITEGDGSEERGDSDPASG